MARRSRRPAMMSRSARLMRPQRKCARTLKCCQSDSMRIQSIAVTPAWRRAADSRRGCAWRERRQRRARRSPSSTAIDRGSWAVGGARQAVELPALPAGDLLLGFLGRDGIGFLHSLEQVGAVAARAGELAFGELVPLALGRR